MCNHSFFFSFHFTNSRTGNCIRRWVDVHWYDFENNEELLSKLLSWIRGPLSRSKFGTLPKTLENLIEKKVC